MAKKRPVPLKDENLLSIDDLYAKLQAIEDAVKNINQESDESLGNRIDNGNQGCAIDTEQLGKSVAAAMDSYLKAHQDKIVVDVEKSTAKQVEEVLEEYKAALLQLQKERQTSQGGSSQDQPSAIHEGLVVSSGVIKPEKPTRRHDLFGYWLYRLPWYQIRTLFASHYFRWWLCTILFCIWLTSIFLTCIIAYDNAKLRPAQEKYVLLREFARPNQEWAEKADYIEYLYSDEEEHRKEIENLWEQRRKRLHNGESHNN